MRLLLAQDSVPPYTHTEDSYHNLLKKANGQLCSLAFNSILKFQKYPLHILKITESGVNIFKRIVCTWGLATLFERAG